MSEQDACLPVTERLDLRLVPAALTGWLVTAAGIVWPVGAVAAVLGAVLAAAAGALYRWAGRGRGDLLRTVGAGLAAVGAVGAGFGCAVALRADAAGHHPITAAFGTVAPVTVTPTESAVPVGSRRRMFRATMQRIGADQAPGASVARFS